LTLGGVTARLIRILDRRRNSGSLEMSEGGVSRQMSIQVLRTPRTCIDIPASGTTSSCTTTSSAATPRQQHPSIPQVLSLPQLCTNTDTFVWLNLFYRVRSSSFPPRYHPTFRSPTLKELQPARADEFPAVLSLQSFGQPNPKRTSIPLRLPTIY